MRQYSLSQNKLKDEKGYKQAILKLKTFFAYNAIVLMKRP